MTAAVLGLAGPHYAMLGVYAAQCYEARPFMAPAQATRVSGARPLLCKRGDDGSEGCGVVHRLYIFPKVVDDARHQGCRNRWVWIGRAEVVGEGLQTRALELRLAA